MYQTVLEWWCKILVATSQGPLNHKECTIYWVPSPPALVAFFWLFALISTIYCWVRIRMGIIVFILHRRKLRSREEKWLAQNHTAKVRQSCNQEPHSMLFKSSSSPRPVQGRHMLNVSHTDPQLSADSPKILDTPDERRVSQDLSKYKNETMCLGGPHLSQYHRQQCIQTPSCRKPGRGDFSNPKKITETQLFALFCWFLRSWHLLMPKAKSNEKSTGKGISSVRKQYLKETFALCHFPWLRCKKIEHCYVIQLAHHTPGNENSIPRTPCQPPASAQAHFLTSSTT